MAVQRATGVGGGRFFFLEVFLPRTRFWCFRCCLIRADGSAPKQNRTGSLAPVVQRSAYVCCAFGFNPPDRLLFEQESSPDCQLAIPQDLGLNPVFAMEA